MMDGLFRLVLTTSLYASIVGLVILVFKAVLKNKINARWHYLLWVVLILKLLMPFGPESVISLFNTMPVEKAQHSISSIAFQKIPDSINTVTPGGAATAAPSEPVQATGPTQTEVTEKSILPYIWLSGVLAMLAWLAAVNFLLHRKLLRHAYSRDNRISSIFHSCKQTMQIKSNIALIFQDKISTPALFGIIKPKILLPSAIAGLSDKELEYVLLHELAHHKRKDILANYLLLILQALHWFNPVMWYCFGRIRYDMESAADEKVLEILESSEHKQYGRTLITVLENFSSSKLAPRLIGMVDDRKNIERRIKMLKMAGAFKARRKAILVTGLVCILLLSGVLLTSGKGVKDDGTAVQNPADSSGTYAADLLKYKSPYIGDASNVSNLLNKLSLGPYKKKIELSTEKPPYGLTVYCDLSGSGSYSPDTVYTAVMSDAAIVFSLIANVENVNYEITFGDKVYEYAYTRDPLQKYFTRALGEYSQDSESFKEFLSALQSTRWDNNPGSYTAPDTLPTDSDSLHTTELNKAVSLAIMAQSAGYLEGEVATEGHVILGSEEKDGKVKAYTISSYGAFGFENGVFTMISGSGAIPAVITFSKNDKGEYTLLEYKEAMDGALYTKSLEEMFPKELLSKVQQADSYYPGIAAQKEAYASSYLKSIGINAQISSGYVEKKLANINVEASNKLLTMSGLAAYPYWLGTRTQIENGIRYTYEKSLSRTSDGFDLVTYRKSRDNGVVVQEYRYKIVGDQPVLLGSGPSD